jgi:hypothetical protein
LRKSRVQAEIVKPRQQAMLLSTSKRRLEGKMGKSLWRLGRLGLFVALAGVSWFIEACDGKDEGAKGGNSGGAAGSDAGTTGGIGSHQDSGGSSSAPAGGTTSNTTTNQDPGGQGGLHDVPCE